MRPEANLWIVAIGCLVHETKMFKVVLGKLFTIQVGVFQVKVGVAVCENDGHSG
jgi:hypothetical protein